MDGLDCVHLKLKYCSLIWRRVQLRLSYEHHWTKHNEVAVLSITRRRRRPFFSESDFILLDQILLDSSTHLLPPSSRDLRHLRFSLQYGQKIFNFQASDEVTYEMWRVAIVDAISETAEMEQRLQTPISMIDIDVEKGEKDGDVVLRQLDRDQAKVYVRDAINCKLIRLHQPAAFIATAHRNLEQTLDGNQYETTGVAPKTTIMFSWLLDTVKHEYPVASHCETSASTEEDDVDATVSAAVDAHYGHLVDAVGHPHKFPNNQEANMPNVSSHTVIISEDHSGEESAESTATRTSSDGDEEVLDLITPMQTEGYCHTAFPTSRIKQRSSNRNPTARETLRHRLMETDTTKHGMLRCPSTPNQPEEELDGMFDTRYIVHQKFA